MPIEVSVKALTAVTDFSYFFGVLSDESYDTVLSKVYECFLLNSFHFILFYKHVILWQWIVISDGVS